MKTHVRMSPGVVCLLLAWLMSIPTASLCALSNPVPFGEANSRLPCLVISVYAPPALLVVVDEQGRRTGVDLTKPVDRYGQGTEMADIPASMVDPLNTSDDVTLQPAPTTDWEVGVYTIAAVTCGVELHGLTTAVARVRCRGYGPENPGQVWKDTENRYIGIIVSPGVVTKLEVTFDPEALTVVVARGIVPGDLGHHVGTACQLGLVSPDGVCRSLTAKANAAAGAALRGNQNAARGSWQAFINELAAQGDKHIKEPALTILREEAVALLNSPPAIPQVRRANTAK